MLPCLINTLLYSQSNDPEARTEPLTELDTNSWQAPCHTDTHTYTYTQASQTYRLVMCNIHNINIYRDVNGHDVIWYDMKFFYIDSKKMAA